MEFIRYRLIYRRHSPGQFVSHLDVLGVLERALRRLGLPLEFTAGMRPHLRLKASLPLAVGMTSQAEYLDFGLEGLWEPEMLEVLQEALPPGFTALKVIPQPEGSPSLGALDTFLYRATPVNDLAPNLESPPLLRGGGGDLHTAILELLESPELPMQHSSPGKVVPFDGRPAIWKLELAEDGSLLIGLKSSGGPMPKVTDILRQLTDASSEEIISQWSVERLGQWWDIGGQQYNPTENYIHGCENPVPLSPLYQGGQGGS